MTPDNIITLIAAGLAFAASLVATIVSIYNARLRRFALERWWERKAQAYADVVGSLVSLTYSLNRWSDREYEVIVERQIVFSDEDKDIILAEYSKAEERVERAATEGSYILSEKSANALSDLIRVLQESSSKEYPGWTDWYESLIERLEAAKDCLNVLRDEAKKDLKVK